MNKISKIYFCTPLYLYYVFFFSDSFTCKNTPLDVDRSCSNDHNTDTAWMNASIKSTLAAINKASGEKKSWSFFIQPKGKLEAFVIAYYAREFYIMINKFNYKVS